MQGIGISTPNLVWRLVLGSPRRLFALGHPKGFFFLGGGNLRMGMQNVFRFTRVLSKHTKTSVFLFILVIYLHTCSLSIDCVNQVGVPLYENSTIVEQPSNLVTLASRYVQHARDFIKKR